MQDCVCLKAPYPFNVKPTEDFDVSEDFDITGEGDLWYAQPELFFSCSLCRTGHQENVSTHTKVALVFFSTFEPITLSPDHIMQADKQVPMLYKRSDKELPTLYICPVENVLGRVPLIPCYMKGNTHPTIPYCLRRMDLGGAAADSREDSGTGSRLFEVNMWMWKYGRSLPRQETVQEAEETRRSRLLESRKKGAATAKRRREASDGSGAQ